MYVCMYVHTCLRIHTRVHVLTFVRICYIYIYIYHVSLHVLGQPRELHVLTYTHTMLLHIVLYTMAQHHRYSGSHVRRYVHMALLGFTCLACIGLAMRATQAYIRTNDVAAHCATVARHHCYSCAMSPHKTASSAN